MQFGSIKSKRVTLLEFALALALTALASAAATPKPHPLPRCHGPHFGIITDDGRTYDCASTAQRP